MTTFKTDIAPSWVSIYHVTHLLPELTGKSSGGDYDIEPNTFTVTWNFELETRDWGVKSMIRSVTKIEGSFDVIHYYDDERTETIEFDPDGFEIEMNISPDGEWCELAPDTIEIDHESKKVFVC